MFSSEQKDYTVFFFLSFLKSDSQRAAGPVENEEPTFLE